MAEEGADSPAAPNEKAGKRSTPSAKSDSVLPSADDEEVADPSLPAAEESKSPGAVAGSSFESDPRLDVCDWIYLRIQNEPVKVQLQSTMIGDWEPEKNYKFNLYRKSANSKSLGVRTIKGAVIRDVEYFEQRVLEVAAEKLGIARETIERAGHTIDLSTMDSANRAGVATKILLRGIKEHDSAVQRNLREDPNFRTVLRRPLLVALYNLRLSSVDSIIREEKFLEATRTCDDLSKQFEDVDPSGKEIVRRYETIFVAQAKRSFGAQHFAEARDWLAQLERSVGSEKSPLAVEVRGAMLRRAREQVQLADAAKDKGNLEEAMQHLDRAKDIWPELADIDARRQKWDQEYPILRCAYPSLPRNLVPSAIRTPVERHAASLIFEGLVRWTNASNTGLPHYEACLAEERPVSLPRGRQFRLRRCEWWDPDEKQGIRHFFSAEDVLWSEAILRETPWISAQTAQLDETSHHGDPFRIDILLKLDHWQPLSFMDFWILPKYRFPQGKSTVEALRELNERPVGTGPYYLFDRREDSVRLRANPRFRERGTPRIQEIQFNQVDADRSHEQFINGKVDLVYGVRKAHRDQLNQAGRQSSLHRLNTSSVYFLAPNYSQTTTPLKNRNFRLAIAHAVDRSEILKQYFRDDEHDQGNQEVTGPFPKQSWAYNTAVPAFTLDNAKSYLQLAREELRTIPRVSLLYPDDDPDTENACRQIQADLQKIGIDMDIQSVTMNDWYERVVNRHDFELVYWRHDFLNETYSLWPLFDPKAKDRGTSFMSYDLDEHLGSLFNQLRQHKQFVKIRDLTHRIHEHIAKNAIVVPLWQLDTYVAVSERLQNVTLDPRTLFSDVQHWSLLPQRP
jgi:MarR-like DNA-binding transcriptional regulator SgrR of sgrS sRNA